MDSLTIKKTDDFEVSGEGTHPAWQTAQAVDIVQRHSLDHPMKTWAKLLYSETGLYFLFDCEDSLLQATMDADFLDLWEEDVVEIFLMPDETVPVYFEYELSPLNYELPLLVPNLDGHFLGWRPWKYRGDRKTIHKTSVRGGPKESGAKISGWSAEFFIPFSLLQPLIHQPPVSGNQWRGNLYRIDYLNDQENHFSWQLTRTNFHDVENFGRFIFE